MLRGKAARDHANRIASEIARNLAARGVALSKRDVSRCAKACLGPRGGLRRYTLCVAEDIDTIIYRAWCRQRGLA